MSLFCTPQPSGPHVITVPRSKLPSKPTKRFWNEFSRPVCSCSNLRWRSRNIYGLITMSGGSCTQRLSCVGITERWVHPLVWWAQPMGDRSAPHLPHLCGQFCLAVDMTFWGILCSSYRPSSHSSRIHHPYPDPWYIKTLSSTLPRPYNCFPWTFLDTSQWWNSLEHGSTENKLFGSLLGSQPVPSQVWSGFFHKSIKSRSQTNEIYSAWPPWEEEQRDLVNVSSGYWSEIQV